MEKWAQQPILTAAYPGHLADMKVLLEAFLKLKTTDFTSFRDIWKTMLFSTIHEGRLKETTEKDADYTQALFSTALGFFQLNHTFERRIGTLYLLYLLYETQPEAATSSRKHKINVSIALWRELQKLYEEIKERKIADAYAIFRKMQRLVFREGFFSIHAVLRSTPSSTNTISQKVRSLDDLTTDTTANADTLTGTIDFEQLEKAAAQYQQSPIYQSIFNAVDASSPSAAPPPRPLVTELHDVMAEHERAKYFRVLLQNNNNSIENNPADADGVPKAKRSRSRKWPPPAQQQANAANASGADSPNTLQVPPVASSSHHTHLTNENFDDMPDLGVSAESIALNSNLSASPLPPNASSLSSSSVPVVPSRVLSSLRAPADKDLFVEKEDSRKENELASEEENNVLSPPTLPATPKGAQLRRGRGRPYETERNVALAQLLEKKFSGSSPSTTAAPASVSSPAETPPRQSKRRSSQGGSSRDIDSELPRKRNSSIPASVTIPFESSIVASTTATAGSTAGSSRAASASPSATAFTSASAPGESPAITPKQPQNSHKASTTPTTRSRSSTRRGRSSIHGVSTVYHYDESGNAISNDDIADVNGEKRPGGGGEEK